MKTTLGALSQTLSDIHNHNVNIKLRDIYLHSLYEDASEGEPGVEYRQATTFVKNLHFLESYASTPILIHMHSSGGCYDDGMAMFNAIRFAKSHVSIISYSQASSMSSVLLQAAPTRIMMPDCHFMMHYGWGGSVISTPHGVKSMADFTFKSCKRMLIIYAERAIRGKFFKQRKSSTVESVSKFFDRKLKANTDWFLDAEEAVFYGLADDVLGSRAYPTLDSVRTPKEARLKGK